MKVFRFIKELFKEFPVLLIVNTFLLIAASLLGAFSLFSVSPLVDLFVDPNLENMSPLTEKAVGVLGFFGVPTSFMSWTLVFVGLVMITSALLVTARFCILKTKYKVLRKLMLKTYEDFFNARWHFFSSGKEGVLLNTFAREFSVVGDAFGAMALFFSSIIQTVLFFAVPFYISWQVTSISLIVAIAFAVPFIFLGKISYRWGLKNTSTGNQIMMAHQENFSLAKSILGFGNQKKAIDKFCDAFDAHRQVAVRSQTLSTAIPTLYRPFAVIMGVVALFVARYFNVPLSELTVLLLALLQVAISIGNLTMQKNLIENFLPSYEQIQRLQNKARELKQVSGEQRFEKLEEGIEIRNLSFAYPNHEHVLKNVDISIPKGKMIAFAGKSGSGKSTLIDLIMGFHEIKEGEVAIDNTLLKDFDVTSYRKRIGYVPQNSVLFNMTIRDNLLWANENATDEEIEKVCELAHVKEFITNMPDGLDTLVGDRGVRLSGGQMQRIALARALLRKPELLILDEATSALDSESENLIQEAINAISHEYTIIIIAHRLSTIQNADTIYVLDNGEVVESGTHFELLEKGGKYQMYYNMQLNDDQSAILEKGV